MTRNEAKAESLRREALAQKRLRGHRIKHGLDELGDLDAAPTTTTASAAPSLKKSETDVSDGDGKRGELPASHTRATRSGHQKVHSHDHSFPPYKSVFGDGWASWRAVKQTLFSPSASPSEKADALRVVRLWRARVRKHRQLPAYVEATELLMRCVLQEEQTAEAAARASGQPSLMPPISAQSDVLAAAYGAALARSVHVMTGSFATEAATTYRRRAREIGFPEEAVEVRQRVAHGTALPSLSELRWTCGLVLQFLFQQYWVEQERQVRLMEEEEEEENAEEAGHVAGRDSKATRKAGRRGKAGNASRAPAPQTSVEEMKALLAQLGSDSESEMDTAERDVEPSPQKRTKTAPSTKTSRVLSGGWSVE